MRDLDADMTPPLLTESHAAPETALDTHAPVVHVSCPPSGGWDIRIEREGEAPALEHYSDWHRVERRRAILALTDHVRVAALLLATVLS